MTSSRTCRMGDAVTKQQKPARLIMRASYASCKISNLNQADKATHGNASVIIRHYWVAYDNKINGLSYFNTLADFCLIFF